MPLLSVVIPTHRRAPVLRLCLEHLARQTVADQIEVIVVSDGGDEETKRAGSGQPAVRFIEIPPCHQGVARNRGVEMASAPHVLFIGDDILLERDACEVHIRACPPLSPPGGKGLGDRGPFAILGHTSWDGAVGITPVMRWLDRTGWQFGYGQLGGYAHRALPQAIQHRFTYTSHISLEADIARRFPFRDDAALYGWEDIEWGMRLRDAGVALIYEPDARALHHHRLTLADSLARMETIGRSAAMMARINLAFDRIPRGWKRLAYHCLSVFPTMRGKHAKAFLRGMRKV